MPLSSSNISLAIILCFHNVPCRVWIILCAVMVTDGLDEVSLVEISACS